VATGLNRTRGRVANAWHMQNQQRAIRRVTVHLNRSSFIKHFIKIHAKTSDEQLPTSVSSCTIRNVMIGCARPIRRLVI